MTAIKKKCRTIYPEASEEDPTSDGNAVNQFVSYHLLPFMEKYEEMKNSQTIYRKRTGETNNYDIKQADTPFYYRPMGSTARLMKMVYSYSRNDVRINRHAYYDTSYYGNHQETGCDIEGILVSPDNREYPNYAPNGYYYPIDHILVYNEEVRNVVLNERIRYDVLMNIPEIRTAIAMNIIGFLGCYIPHAYCENIQTNSDMYYHQPASLPGSIVAYKRDYLETSSDRITLKLLPVPFSGRWEIRLPLLQGIVRLSLGEGTGIKEMKDIGTFDLAAINHRYKLPQEYDISSETGLQIHYDTLLLQETDKNCRLHGFMKLPYGYGVDRTDKRFYWESARNRNTNSNSTANPYRYIIYRGYLEAGKDYWLHVRNLLPNQYYNADYIEIVPESVYDNPDKAEDWW